MLCKLLNKKGAQNICRTYQINEFNEFVNAQNINALIRRTLVYLTTLGFGRYFREKEAFKL